MVLGRSKLFQEVFGAFADVGKGADAAGYLGEGVGEDGVVEDDLGAGGSHAVERLQEGGPGFRTQGLLGAMFFRLGIGIGYDGGDALEGHVSAFDDEGGNAEAFPLEGTGFQVLGVGAGLSFG